MDKDTSGADEYYTTAQQIFDYCGARNAATLRVDVLMDKFAPFVKTNKSEYSFLKSLLDPNHDNPEISVTRLANTLHTYSESQKQKLDLDESFNKSGLAPHDSDSGISTDGYQMLEELQSELREKSRLAHQLRSQLDYSDRQHEEALALLTAERDSVRIQLNMLHDENASLNNIRSDYEEACEKLCSSEKELKKLKKELETARKNDRVMRDQVATMENEKLTLQEQLAKSKEECHRINEMYAGRQSALLEQNESLRAERADHAARLHDQEDFMQQIIKEKVMLEMELKEILNKSNQPHLRLDRSIDVSYTEDQMLTALDTLNTASSFAPENQILDEETFAKALREEQGRHTNISLFDEIRLSFSTSRHNISSFQDTFSENYKENDNFFNNATTQTFDNDSIKNEPFRDADIVEIKLKDISVQVDESIVVNDTNSVGTNTEKKYILLNFSKDTQTLEIKPHEKENKIEICEGCVKLTAYSTELESDVKHLRGTASEIKFDLDKYEYNLKSLQAYIDEKNSRSLLLQALVDALHAKLNVLESASVEQKSMIESITCDTCCVDTQTESELLSVSTQAEIPCNECVKRNGATPHRLRRYLWEPVKCLFQLFAVVCFVCAVSVLYGVSKQAGGRCEREPTPWRWFDAQDIMDLLLRIEYVADVPM